MFKHYLKTTFRNLWNGGFQTVFTIVGLAVAFFCFGICAYFVHGLLTVDNYYENHDRVFAVKSLEETDSELRLFMNVNFNPEDFIDNFPDVESVFAYRNELNPFVVEDDGTTNGQPEDDQSEFLYVIYCDTTLQHFYNPALLAGSWDAATSSENSMLMSAKYARRLFGSVDAALGRRLTQGLSGTTYTVRAVIEDLPPNNSIAAFQPGSCWIMNSRDIDMYLNLRILLRQGVGVDSFNDKFALPTSYGQAGTYSFKAVPTDNLKSGMGMGDKYILVLLLILAPGLIVLLSALGNFLHLLISSIFKRDREYTLRKVNGARGWDLWLMVGIQVLVTMLLVGITTIVIIMLCTPMLHISLYATLDFEFDTATMLRQSFLHIFILLLLGLLVAWIATVRIRRHTMQAHLRPDTGHHLWRNIMIGGQMTVSFIFVTLLCAMLLQVRKNMSGIYPGLTKNEMKEILIIPELGDDPSMGARIEQTLDAIPSVREYVHSSIWDGTLTPNHGVIQSSELIEWCMCSPDELQFLGVSLLEGRWLGNADEVMVDARLVDAHGISAGDELTIERPYYEDEDVRTVTVAGIVDAPKDFGRDNHYYSKASQFSVYMYVPSAYYKTYMVKCLPGTVDEVRKAVIDNIYHEYYPGQVTPEIPTLYDNLQQTNRVERALMRFFWLFAGIAVIISLLGIYSVVTMETTVRRKEMAIRKINGAKTHQIAALLGRFYLRLLLISAAIAFPFTYIFFHLLETSSAMAIWRQMFNYGLLFYLCVFLIVAAFVTLTVAAQIRRIARIEPYTIVKSE